MQQRIYEVMFIVKPDMPEEDQERLISGLENSVLTSGGIIKSVERMGKRQLAYTVRTFNQGIYILLTIEGPGAVVYELERRLRVTEPVIKFLTVRMDEQLKRVAKMKAIRAQHVRRPIPAPEPQPEAEAPPEPSAEASQ